jgi:hypothetical protein
VSRLPKLEVSTTVDGGIFLYAPDTKVTYSLIFRKVWHIYFGGDYAKENLVGRRKQLWDALRLIEKHRNWPEGRG